MKKMKMMIAICSAVLLVLVLGVIAQAQAANFGGIWVMSYVSGNATVVATLTFTQDGNSLKGSMRIGDAFETPVDSGSVSGNDIAFSVTRQGVEAPLKTEYKGTLAGDTIKGTFMRGQNSIDWTAKRK